MPKLSAVGAAFAGAAGGTDEAAVAGAKEAREATSLLAMFWMVEGAELLGAGNTTADVGGNGAVCIEAARNNSWLSCAVLGGPRLGPCAASPDPCADWLSAPPPPPPPPPPPDESAGGSPAG